MTAGAWRVAQCEDDSCRVDAFDVLELRLEVANESVSGWTRRW